MNISGCAEFSIKQYFVCKFSENSILYFAPKAKKGILQKVVVKEVMIRFLNGNNLAPVFLYKDTDNAYFNEDELCSQLEGITFAENFYTQQKNELLGLLNQINCS